MEPVVVQYEVVLWEMINENVYVYDE